MAPTFATSDYLIIDRLSYRFDNPERGDVIVFRYPLDRSKYFIKRIIGLPGERIVVSDSKVTIYNDKNEKGFVLDEPYVKYIRGGNTDIQVAEGQYFVLGDNRLSSSDSRVWGPILKSDIVGRAYVRLFPFSEIDYLPGEFEIQDKLLAN